MSGLGLGGVDMCMLGFWVKDCIEADGCMLVMSFGWAGGCCCKIIADMSTKTGTFN